MHQRCKQSPLLWARHLRLTDIVCLQLSRWQAVETLGILAECAMFALAIYLAAIGRMTRNARVKIALLFATRILCVPSYRFHC
jgi:hypothetical protein